MDRLSIRTPLVESHPISKNSGRKVFLKLENVQPGGSFKIRGIGHLCIQAKKDGIEHFVSSSGGNAGFAAAFAGRILDIKTTVYVPTTTGDETILKIRNQGANVIVQGNVWDETHEHAVQFCNSINGLYISPFDHPLIWEGHSVIIDEIVEEIPEPDAIILSVGGGGLLCGIAEGLHRNHWNDIPIIAVETEGTASLAASVKAGKLITLDKISGVAKSLGAKTVAKKAFEWTMNHNVHSCVVSDIDAITSCMQFAADHRYLVEPACGASLSIAYNNNPILEKMKSVVIIVCGGIGVDIHQLLEWSHLS